MWFYYFVRPFARWSLKWYLGRIDLANLDRIPKDKPLIFAANHPTTFVEPCILACFQERPLHFLARGDFFQIKGFSSFLRGVNIIPIYRLKDAGHEGVKNNFQSFEECYKALAKNKTIMILAEGRCIHEKRLRPIQKGGARIALGAMEAENLDEVYIVPIGVNFTYADRLRSDVMLNVAEPIAASEYLKAFRESQTGAIKDLTEELRNRLYEEVIHIDQIEDEALFEGLVQIYRSEHPRNKEGRLTQNATQLKAEKKIADRLNETNESTKKKLAGLVNGYFAKLQSMRLTDAAIAGNFKQEQKQTTVVFAGLIPALLLAIWHLPVWALAQWIAGTKIKAIEFSSPVRWGAFTALYLIYPLCWIIPAIIYQAWLLLAVAIISLLGLPWLLRHIEKTIKWFQAWRVSRQPPHELTYVRKLRSQIIANELMNF